MPTTVYSGIKNKQVNLLPHSVLYHLEPMNVASPLTESLTGYISRLAAAHLLPTGVLFSKIIAPRLNKKYVLSTGALKSQFRRSTKAINGIGKVATDLVNVLESLTCRKDLRFLTLLPWSEVISHRYMLRPVRAWCPVCYDEWQKGGLTVYEPLIWAFNVLSICAVHHRLLSTACPYCNKQMLLLTIRSRPGYCSHCGQWLGSDSLEDPTLREITNEEMQWGVFVSNELGRLISAAPRLSNQPVRQRIAKSISTCIEQITHNDGNAFVRLIKMEENTVWQWRTGKRVPELSMLLFLCFQVGIPAVEFLSGEHITSNLRKRDAPITVCKVNKIRRKPIDPVKVGSILEEVIEDDDTPPLSLLQVAKHNDCNPGVLYKHFKTLCLSISSRYKKYQIDSSLKRKELLREEIRGIAHQLHIRGIYPSVDKVKALMTKPGGMSYQYSRALLRAVRSELGLD